MDEISEVGVGKQLQIVMEQIKYRLIAEEISIDDPL